MDGAGTFLNGPYTGTRMLDWALAYAERGWHVFQMRQGTKEFFGNCSRCKPSGDHYDTDAHAQGSEQCTLHPEGYARCHGLWSATQDPAVIHHWWTENPHANIGINCGRSGIACVDIDIKHHDGKFGDRSMAALEERRGDFPTGPRAVTASGGGHWVFGLPDGHELRSSTGYTDAKGRAHGLADWVDIKAVGGLMVAAPSLVYDSKRGVVTGQYTWETDGDLPVPVLPSWVAEEIVQREKRESAKPSARLSFPRSDTAEYDEVKARVIELADEVAANRGEGGRNNLLLQNAGMAFQYAGAGQISPDEVEDIFVQAGIGCGLPETEARRTTRNARNHNLSKPRAWAPSFKKSDAAGLTNLIRPRTAPQAEPTPERGAAPVTVPEQGAPTPETVEQVFESREAFTERMKGIEDPASRKNEARTRVKHFARLKSTEEERQVERDFLKATTGLSKGDFDSLYSSTAMSGKKSVSGTDGKPMLDLTEELDGYINLVGLIQKRIFPETYVRDGKLVHVQPVSGVRATNKKFNTSTYQAKDITASTMRRLVALHTRTMKLTEKGVSSPLPAPSLCEAVLTESDWQGLPLLNALVDAPFVREDGTICQVAGYDEASGMWLGLPEGYIPVPENPSAEDVAEARALILDQALRDFPFVTTADRANAVGMLLTPMIRFIIKCPVPFCFINAHAPGSGKTLLAKIAIAAHGGGSWTFPLHDEAEQRKQLTTILMDQASPVVNFDNLKRGSTIDAATLDSMLTEDIWKDRVLGANISIALPNDKLWLGTGNNIKPSRDLSTRSFLVELDAKMERPDLRPTNEFELGDLEQWLLQPQNRATLVRSLLILIRDWAAAGMPKITKTMRVFTPWAGNVGGILKHHGIDGFLANEHLLAEADEEQQQDSLFLQKWMELIGVEPITASDLIVRYRATITDTCGSFNTMGTDPWQGSFPARANDKPYSAVGLGRWLGRRKSTPMSGFVLRGRHDKAASKTWWWPERMPDNPVPIPAQGVQESLI
ncbi:bifunctional DNA primase/polymerase [Streptomyces sp. NPDC050535]|uniref:bifunctional DNA primase/polymerase n=1 Tax=Streptomyces sp. NPDC050535 TaxID=3365626 RepID=UPI00378FEBF6